VRKKLKLFYKVKKQNMSNNLAANVTKDEVLAAATHIKKNNLDLRVGTKFSVEVDGDLYPPKEIIRVAARLKGLDPDDFSLSGGDCNKYLERMEFDIVSKNSDDDPMDLLILKYKKRIRETKLEGEIYKWELINEYRGRPNIYIPDFHNEIKSVKFLNLIYAMGIAVINHLVREKPEETKALFKGLFNDVIDLEKRVVNFNSESLKLYRSLGETLSHHQDERTIATYLTFHNPDKYALYKDSFYQKYCKFLGLKPKQKNEKYTHYLELLKDFITDYITEDNELIGLVSGFLTDKSYKDPNHLLLAQDILFQIFDQGEEEIDIEENRLYKISMGDFEKSDYDRFINENKILVNQHTKAKATTTITQGDIFKNKMQIGDYFYLTHGNKGISLLGRITSKPSLSVEESLKGWLERDYEVVLLTINKSKYTGKKKWWTPNDNSTIIEIKPKSIIESTKLIFKPFFNAKIISSRVAEENEVEKEPKQIENMITPLNQILYGPPGTGKTFKTRELAVSIINPSFKGNREEIKSEYERLVNLKQIVFTTFHQSFGYEDFIEGIKPQEPEDDSEMVYKVEEGIFKKLCIDASFSFIDENRSSEVENVLDFSFVYDNYVQQISEELGSSKVEIDLKSGGKVLVDSISDKGNIIIKHKNGVRTYTVSKKRLAEIHKSFPDLDKVDNINNQFRGVIGGSNSSAYWSVLNAIRKTEPKIVKSKVERNYDFEDKKSAIKSLSNADYDTSKAKSFVLIIDEINRGNVSQIFGELITLIEPDKRLGNKESLKVELPYSKDLFGVPSNVHIVGTMNTADRSVEALDTALRRRFSFKELMPKSNLISPSALYCRLLWEYESVEWEDKEFIAKESSLFEMLGVSEEFKEQRFDIWDQMKRDDEKSKGTYFDNLKYSGVNPEEILDSINSRIELLIDRDHAIGHSYFINMFSLTDLVNVFNDKIMPLLQEYFYGDYGKIGLVLGSGFISLKNNAEISFSDFEAQYERLEEFKIPTYQLIRNNEETIVQALSLLLNKKQID
jgi:5-methylcytosine-specific restriction protein B